jgi:hypothetical protein
MLCWVVQVCLPAWSQETPEENPFGPVEHSTRVEPAGSEADQKIKQILDGPLHEAGLEFFETPLSEVMKFISEEYDLAIKIDEAALKDLELSTDAPVTAQMRNISLRMALRLMLKEHDLTYVVDGGQLVITSEDVAIERSGVRVYSTGSPLILDLTGESPTEQPTSYFEASAAHKRNTKIRHVLASPLLPDGLDISEMPLGDFATLIREQYKIEVQLDVQGLDDLGLTPDDAITFRIANVPLGVGIRETLRQFDLTYIVRDGFLLITSEDEALSAQSVRIYPVGDLLQPSESHPDMPAATMADLIRVIQGSLVEEGWDSPGGTIEQMQPGILVVTHTDEKHQQIAELLAAMRRAREHEFAIPHAPKQRKGKREKQGETSSTPAEQSGGGAF